MALKRIITSDQNLQLIQDNVAQALSTIQGSPFQNGLILPGVALVSGVNTVPHKLGRAPQGWFLIDPQSAVTVYRVSQDSKFLNLQASAGATVSIWVF